MPDVQPQGLVDLAQPELAGDVGIPIEPEFLHIIMQQSSSAWLFSVSSGVHSTYAWRDNLQQHGRQRAVVRRARRRRGGAGSAGHMSRHHGHASSVTRTTLPGSAAETARWRPARGVPGRAGAAPFDP